MTEPGWVYVLASRSHPGIVKIGRTSRHTQGRVVEIERSEYAPFGPWTEVLSKAVADPVRVETSSHRMLANRRIKLGRLPCRELFRVDAHQACRVVEAAAGSLIAQPRPVPRPLKRFRPRRRWGRPLAAFGLLLALALLLRDPWVHALLAVLRP